MMPFAHLSPEELNTLYGNFVVYRDAYCNGWAKMSIQEFHKQFGLNEYEHPEDKFNKTLGDCLYGTYGGFN
jgi:hypothetical protein